MKCGQTDPSAAKHPSVACGRLGWSGRDRPCLVIVSDLGTHLELVGLSLKLPEYLSRTPERVHAHQRATAITVNPVTISAMIARAPPYLDNDNDNATASIALPSNDGPIDYSTQYDALIARAGHPAHLSMTGLPLAPNPNKYIARHQMTANTISKNRFSSGMALFAEQGGSTVQGLIDQVIIKSLEPKDTENPGTHKHRLQTLMLWDEFIENVGIPYYRQWLPAVVKTYASAFLRLHVSDHKLVPLRLLSHLIP